VILLAGVPRERPLAMVRAALEEIGAPHVLFDQSLPQTELVLTGMGGKLEGWLRMPDGAEVPVGALRAAYPRMLDHTRLPGYQRAPAELRAAADAANLALSTCLELLPGMVLNRASAMASNRSKAYQLGLIRRMGFGVPPTLVTNDPALVRRFRARHGRVVFKSVSAVRSIVTELDDAAAERLGAIRACPVQFQALVEGLDVRVHVVGERLFATACESPVVDYRYAAGAARLTPFELPAEVAARCVALAQSLDLPLAGIDLKRRPEGDWVCFEVNPSPGFSWFESATGQPIAAAIAALLATA
jgi:hypothetical protein